MAVAPLDSNLPISIPLSRSPSKQQGCDLEVIFTQDAWGASGGLPCRAGSSLVEMDQ
jgi:hypothetical protein